MYYLSVYGVDPNRQLVGQLGSEGLCSYIHNKANQTLYVLFLCTQSPKQQPLTLCTTVQYRVLLSRSYYSCVALLILALQQLHRRLTVQAWAGNCWTCIVQCNLSSQPFTKSQLYLNKPYSTISGNFRMFCAKFWNPTNKS